MKYLAITLIVLLTGCSKAPDVLTNILDLAAKKREQLKILTGKEKQLVEQAEDKEWADVNK